MRNPQKKDTVVDMKNIRAGCRNCPLRTMCLPLGLGDSEIRDFEAIIERHRKLKKGARLYRVGDPFRALFAIRSGSTKSCEVTAEGGLQITGFHLPGELLGVDAINAGQHPCDVVALEPTEVCEIPFDRLETLSREIPAVQHQLFKLMSREIETEETQLLMLGRMRADARLAAFLTAYARRLERLGQSPVEVRLPMSRQDLGDFLGLALETVSRLFSRFQDDGHILVQGRRIRIRNADGLRRVTEKFGPSHSVNA